MRATRLPYSAGPGGRRGFSLMELLLVVVIIGIVAATVVPRVSVSTDASRDTVQTHQMAHLNKLVELYFHHNGSYPAALTDLSPTYLPSGVPTPPHGGSYSLNAATHRVEHTP